MTLISTTVQCDIRNSFRVQQVAGLFDLPLSKTVQETFAVEVPGAEEDWRIGAIIGPSGSGKSTIARAAFGGAISEPTHGARSKAVIDGFST